MSLIAALVAELAGGTRTAVDLALAAFDRAEADRSIFAMRDDATVLLAAAEADRLRAAGDKRPLLGVPVTIKDNFDWAGHATTAGSVLLANAEPAVADAAAVARLREAGMIVLGRTGMTEFAFSGLGLNPHFGTPLNPAYPGERRIAGGSSSGAAVSVASGLVPAALGTDTGGSVRIPAAFCGLVGFKPTARTVSLEGVLPLSPSLDSVGMIAASVADCRLLFDLVRDGGGPSSAQSVGAPQSLHLGLVTNYVHEEEERAVGEAFDAALARLEASGVRLSTVTLHALDDIAAIAPHASFSAVEAAAWHRAHLVRERNAYDPRVLARILPGLAIDEDEIAAMASRRAAFASAFSSAAAPFDALVWPTVPMLAPRLDALADDAAYSAVNMRALRNPTIVNLADGCAISLPCQASGEPPVGLTLAAASGADDALFDAATILEPILQPSPI